MNTLQKLRYFLFICVLLSPTVGFASDIIPRPTRKTPQDLPLSRITPYKGTDTDATFGYNEANKRYEVNYKNGKGYVYLNLPYIKTKPGKSYKLTIWFRVTSAKYASFMNVFVRQHASLTSRGTNYGQIHREAQVILPHKNSRQPRYVYLPTLNTTEYLSTSIMIQGNPCHIEIESIRFEVQRKEKRKRIPGGMDTRMSRRKMLRILSRRKASFARVVRRPSARIQINHSIAPPICYRGTFWRPRRAMNKLISQAGIKLQTVNVRFGVLDIYKPLRVPVEWTGHRTYDFSASDKRIELALRADPKIHLIVKLALAPDPDWGKRHPSEVAMSENGKLAVCRMFHNYDYRDKTAPILKENAEWYCPSTFSQVFQRDMKHAIKAWFQHIKKKPYYKAIVGIFLGGGDDGQWGMWDRKGTANLSDYSPAGKTAFRLWLKKKYKTLSAFQQAWNTNTTFDEASIPSVQTRLGLQKNYYHPIDDRPAIDYFHFQSDETSRLVGMYAKHVKQLAGKPIIVGSYYEDGLYGRLNNHWRTRKRHTTPYVDLYVSPLDYGFYRKPGWAGGYSMMVNTLLMHKKQPFLELDLRTNVSSYVNDAYDYFTIGSLRNEKDFHSVHRREVGMAHVLGMGIWYHALGGGSFYTDYAQRGLKESVKIAKWALKHNRRRMKPDVVVLVDEPSSAFSPRWIHGHSQFAATSVIRSALWTSGVPFDVYSMEDLPKKGFPDYKVYIFLNSTYVTRATRKYIDSQLKRKNKTLVWFSGAGYIDERGMSLDNAEGLTGFTLQYDKTIHVLNIEAMPNTLQHFGALSPWQGAAMPSIIGPKFSILDDQATALGKFSTGGEIAIALKSFKDWTSVYIAKPGGMGPDLMHSIAKHAGAKTLAPPGNLIASNGSMIVAHGVIGGTQTLNIPPRSTVTNLITGQIVPQQSSTITIQLQSKETQLYGIVPNTKNEQQQRISFFHFPMYYCLQKHSILVTQGQIP